MNAYILSQIFVCLCYVFLGLTYVTKKRNWILYFCLIALAFNGAHYLLLKKWAGFGVVCVAVIRNILFLVQQKIKALDKYIIDDWIILIFLLIISIMFAFFTYKSPFDLFTIAASIIYTISVWQRNIKAYKILGIISSLLNIIYVVYIRSLFAIILESVFCIALIVVLIIYIINENKEKKNKLQTEIDLNEQKGES